MTQSFKRSYRYLRFSFIYSTIFLTSLLVLAQLVPIRAQDTARAVVNGAAPTIPDTLLFKIQKAQSVITEIKAADKKGYGLSRISAGLADVKTNVAPVTVEVNTPGKAIDAKTLANYRLILNDAQEKLTNWRATLSKSTNELQSRLDAVLSLSNDSLLIVAGNDTTPKKFYAGQLVSLKTQLQESGTLTSTKLQTVSRLLADVSATYLSVSNLQTVIVDHRLQVAYT